MLFNYLEFIENLKHDTNPENRSIYKKWRKFSNASDYREEPFYGYLQKFKTIPYKLPEELVDSFGFDWPLLLQLVGASFSSDFSFLFLAIDENTEITSETLLPELSITVNSSNQKVTKLVSELWEFQIVRLMEIYFVEQINWHIIKEDESKNKNNIFEFNGVEYEMKKRINKYNSHLRDTQNIIKRKSIFI